MKLPLFRTLSAVLVLTSTFAVSHPALSQQQDHILPPTALQQDMTQSSAARQRNEQQIESLYSQPRVRKYRARSHSNHTGKLAVLQDNRRRY